MSFRLFPQIVGFYMHLSENPQSKEKYGRKWLLAVPELKLVNLVRKKNVSVSTLIASAVRINQWDQI